MSDQSSFLAMVKEITGDPKAHKLESVQTLWSGYGEIARYLLPSSQTTCIAKQIDVQQGTAHPRGWASRFSHQRKLSSYKNEQVFYTSLASLSDASCRVPGVIKTGILNNTMWILMEDLDDSGFGQRHNSADISIAMQCINWLANFHANYINKDISNVWPIGTYWFLETRPDEFEAMQNLALQNAAKQIDQRLNQAQFQTLVHGDAKLANFCFMRDIQKNIASTQSAVACVDFQYTGRGVGIKDLVYLLGSCFDSQGLEHYANDLINNYFEQLKLALSDKMPATDILALESEWRGLVPFAFADFERFLDGWAPNHHKLTDYSLAQTNIALQHCAEKLHPKPPGFSK